MAEFLPQAYLITCCGVLSFDPMRSESATDGSSRPVDVWCAIPVYNNAATIRTVAEKTLARLPRVIVVDDGSSDGDVAALLDGLDCVTLRHAANQGKGAAILTAAREAEQRGARWLITLDGDGQHDPADLTAFLELLENAGDDDTFVAIGVRDMSAPHIPKGSRFGMRFSDGWVRLETGEPVRDTQSGFRAYPVRYLNQLRLRARRYDFEIEALVRLLWSGLHVRSVPVNVWYPPQNERRVTFFHPFWDNLRLSRLHAKLITRRLLPWPHRRLVQRDQPRRAIRFSALNPLAFFRELVVTRASPFELAASAAVGVFLGTLPLVASHSIVIAYVTARLRLNPFMSLSIQSLCAPPVVPVACVLLGYRLRTGAWLTDLEWMKVPAEYLARIGDWLIGSLVLAPVLAALAAVGVYAAATWRKRNAKQPKQRGSAFGFAWFRFLLQIGGLRAAYAMLYPVALHYALFDHRARCAIHPYVRHRFPERSRFGQWLATYRIFLEQGRMLVDRYTALTRPSLLDITITAQGEAALRTLAAEGGILLMSHAGNWQAAIPKLARLGKTVHLVMAAEPNRSVSETLQLDGGCGELVQVINAEQFMDAAPRVVAALASKEIVSLMGDRAYGSAAMPVPFLGEPANFPVAAFRIASATGKSVFFPFVPRTGHGRYVIEVSAVALPAGRAELNSNMMRYAAALEAFSDAYPYQCFPFTDMWA